MYLKEIPFAEALARAIDGETGTRGSRIPHKQQTQANRPGEGESSAQSRMEKIKILQKKSDVPSGVSVKS